MPRPMRAAGATPRCARAARRRAPSGRPVARWPRAAPRHARRAPAAPSARALGRAGDWPPPACAPRSARPAPRRALARLARHSSSVLASHTVQVTTEANSSPIITTFTTMSAVRNMPQGDRSRGSAALATEGDAPDADGGTAAGAAVERRRLRRWRDRRSRRLRCGRRCRSSSSTRRLRPGRERDGRGRHDPERHCGGPRRGLPHASLFCYAEQKAPFLGGPPGAAPPAQSL